MAKEQGTSTGSRGYFTTIAHWTAGIVLVFGSIIGIMFTVLAFISGEEVFFFIGPPTLLLSWVYAAVLGTLSEISIKLSKLGGD